jgi:hypothetical protein
MNLIMFAVNALFAALPADAVKTFIRQGVGAIQAYVRATENKVDDLVIPASNLLLAAVDIPGPDGKIDVTSELLKFFSHAKGLKNVFLDAGLDAVEDFFDQGSAKDQIAEKAAGLVRAVLNVPDDDPVAPVS